MIASTASKILWSAESAPIVISVPQKSLSIDPTLKYNVHVQGARLDKKHFTIYNTLQAYKKKLTGNYFSL